MAGGEDGSESPQWLYPAKLVSQPSSWKFHSTECIYHGSVEGVRFDGVWLSSTQQYYNLVTTLAFNDLMQRYDVHIQSRISAALQELRAEVEQLRSQVQDTGTQIASLTVSSSATQQQREPSPPPQRKIDDSMQLRDEVEASLKALSDQLETVRNGAVEDLLEHALRISQLEKTVQPRIPERFAETERGIDDAMAREGQRMDALERQLGPWKHGMPHAGATPGRGQHNGRGGYLDPGCCGTGRQSV